MTWICMQPSGMICIPVLCSAHDQHSSGLITIPTATRQEGWLEERAARSGWMCTSNNYAVDDRRVKGIN